MGNWTYAAVLGFILVASGWLELVMRTRIARRWRRWWLSIAPAIVIFIAWDLYAISAGHWSFDSSQILGVRLPGNLPLEEALFFVVVPTAALLTFEAMRAVKGWPAGDERMQDSSS